MAGQYSLSKSESEEVPHSLSASSSCSCSEVTFSGSSFLAFLSLNFWTGFFVENFFGTLCFDALLGMNPASGSVCFSTSARRSVVSIASQADSMYFFCALRSLCLFVNCVGPFPTVLPVFAMKDQ